MFDSMDLPLFFVDIDIDINRTATMHVRYT